MQNFQASQGGHALWNHEFLRLSNSETRWGMGLRGHLQQGWTAKHQFKRRRRHLILAQLDVKEEKVWRLRVGILNAEGAGFRHAEEVHHACRLIPPGAPFIDPMQFHSAYVICSLCGEDPDSDSVELFRTHSVPQRQIARGDFAARWATVGRRAGILRKISWIISPQMAWSSPSFARGQAHQIA